MGDERLQRLNKAELLERGRPEIGQNPPVLALQLSDLGLDRARRSARGGQISDCLRQHRSACAQSEKVRAELIVQLVRDELSLLVVSLENALHQCVVGAIQAVKRVRERIDLGVEIADLRRSVPFRARAIVAGFKFRQRRPRDPEGLDRAPDQKAGHPHCYKRQQSALERILSRFAPHLVDFIRRIGHQDNQLGRAALQRNRNDGYLGGRAGKGAKPAGRLGLLVRLAENGGG